MPGDSFGHFEIVDTLGEGGMGVVYRARDTRLGRAVAIKVLRPEVSTDPDRTRRFLQEAKAASTLNHPCIVTVHDIGQDGDRGAWIAMECLEGESLRQRLARGRLAVTEVLRIAVEIARGLAAAHAAGIVHRDVKPANVMVTTSGIVKVLDFGLAKLAHLETAADSRRPTVSVSPPTVAGVLLGTPAYMSPEQAGGLPADARSDVYSFGALLYEMLAGRRPFEDVSDVSLLTAILRDPPEPLRRFRPDVDEHLEALVSRCLEKDRDARYPTAAALLPDLEACLARQTGSSAKPRASTALRAAAIALLVAAVAFGAWAWRRDLRERTARREAIPEIQRLVDTDDFVEAFRLAETVRPVLKGDPTYDRLWRDITTAPVTIRTEPEGARVSAKPYSGAEAEWRALGQTPLGGVELPRSYYRFRFEKAGFAPVDVAFPAMTLNRLPPFKLVPKDEAPAGMVLVPGGPFAFRNAPAMDLPDFWLDRYEVTNREFAEFVKAGGYSRRELWQQPFVHRGRTLKFEDAMALFRDRTGRPGPATWELGAFPEGRGDFPVSGVSWYEAAAYAEFRSKSLPTLHHWYRAADLSRFSDILAYSNFGAEGPRAVGQQPSLTSYGNYDMAGNVREWVWNEELGRRYTLGGAWSDPTYLYTGPDALDPMDRSPILGVRCARYPTQPPETTFRPLPYPVRDLSKAHPVDEGTYAIYRRFFDYDPVDLAPKVDAVDDSSEHWRAERVSYTAAYGGERIPAWLFLPKNAAPPFQAVVYFPPGSAVALPSIDRVGSRDFGFLVRSGRAVILPAYHQTYERRKQRPGGPSYAREVITRRAQDVRRTLDFLASRPDIDASHLAFYGLSMGADIGAIVAAVEDRVRTLVLVAGGLIDGVPPEVDGINFAPRVHVPVLMINGRYDFASPLETSQQPLFRLLGTAEKDKKHVLFDSGHVPPWPDVVRESLDWLDIRLGPVARQPLAR